MSTGINIYSAPDGFDSRLFFTGLLSNAKPTGSSLTGYSGGSWTTAKSEFEFHGNDYQIVLTGNEFAFAPGGGVNGYATSATLNQYVGGQWQTIASMAIFLDPDAPSAGVPISSSFWMTPNSVANSLLGHGGLHFNFLGGTGSDKLFGSDYDDYFNGEGGKDKLTGYGGSDQFLFDAIGTNNADHITDFKAGVDSILIDRSDDPTLFAGVTAKNLSKSFHDITNHAEEKDDRILYDHKTGVLSYDPDGKGGHHAIAFAYLDNHASLNWRDLEIF